MTNPNKAKGDQAERLVRDLLIAEGLPAERIPAGTTQDIGDIWTPTAVVQVKNHKRLSLGPWLDETVAQQQHAGKVWHGLIVKRRGYGAPDQWFAVMEAQQFAWMLREIGS